MRTYIHELPDWPCFRYDVTALLNPLAEAAGRRGLLNGRLEGLGFGELQDAKLDAIVSEVTKSSEIEGERLDYSLVRSSIARRLGMETGGVPSGDHRVEGVVAMTVNATERWADPLTSERLFNWHTGLFPQGRGPEGRVRVGAWRDESSGDMQVVSGPMGLEKVHFQAPDAPRLESEMATFIDWFEGDNEPNGIIKAGIAHLWFVTIHPFDDGNGRVGRAILDLALARVDQRPWRCYSVSAQIGEERTGYYNALEMAQNGTLDVTSWLDWYLRCLTRALDSAATKVSEALVRSRFWQRHSDKALNDRQRTVLAWMLLGWDGKMTNKKWQKLTNTIPKTAQRDLAELVTLGIFRVDDAGGRSTAYTLVTEAPELSTSPLAPN